MGEGGGIDKERCTDCAANSRPPPPPTAAPASPTRPTSPAPTAQLLLFAPAAAALARVVEPHHGPRETARLLAVALAGSGAATWALAVTIYAVQLAAGDDAGAILYRPICGFQGGVSALLVALKQLLPDAEVTLLGAVRLRGRHLASAYVAAAVALGFLLGAPLALGAPALFGAWAAWAYLRFGQRRGGGGADAPRGDPAPDFSFASFFPAAARPAAERAAAAASRLGARLPRAGAGAVAGAVAGGADEAAAAAPPPPTAAAERRRERGARALEERLGLAGAAERAAGAPQGLAAALGDAEAGRRGAVGR